MSESTQAEQPGPYQAKTVDVPPLYAWPPRPVALLHYLLVEFLPFDPRLLVFRFYGHEVVEKSLAIAGDICIYTNHAITIEEL